MLLLVLLENSHTVKQIEFQPVLKMRHALCILVLRTCDRGLCHVMSLSHVHVWRQKHVQDIRVDSSRFQ